MLDDLDWWLKLAGALAAPFTLALVFLTAILARETRNTWKKNRAPHVIVTMEPHPQYLAIQLTIENVGGGPAFGIKATVEPEVTSTLGGKTLKLSESSILRPETLKHGQRISTYLGDWKTVAPKRTTVKCVCKDGEGAEHSFTNIIDLSVYEGIIRMNEDHAEKSANELEKIRRVLEEITRDWRRIQVNTYDAEDRAEEERASEKARMERKEPG